MVTLYGTDPLPVTIAIVICKGLAICSFPIQKLLKERIRLLIVGAGLEIKNNWGGGGGVIQLRGMVLIYLLLEGGSGVVGDVQKPNFFFFFKKKKKKKKFTIEAPVV